MIIAKRKPFNEIVQSLDGINRVLLVGCGTCVAVCLAGGEKEVGLLSSQLAIASELAEKKLEIGEATVERQCDHEFLDELRHQVKHYDALLSLACGVGIQFLADQYPDKIVLPGGRIQMDFRSQRLNHIHHRLYRTLSDSVRSKKPIINVVRPHAKDHVGSDPGLIMRSFFRGNRKLE